MTHKHIFVNLPVASLERSTEFFTKIGYTFNQQFTDETATCMVLGENLFAMLLTHPKFDGFAPAGRNPSGNEVLTCFSCESRAEVDEIIGKAVAAGGKTYKEPEDHGFMYGRSFVDLDGHIWEYVWMDPSTVQQG